MKNNIRKSVDQGIRGWILRAGFRASYPLDNLELNTCLGCCSCLTHDMVTVTIHQKTPGAKTRGFLIHMTADLAGRTSPAYICEQIVKRLKEGEVWAVDEAQALKAVDIFEDSNAQIAQIERKAAELDAAEDESFQRLAQEMNTDHLRREHNRQCTDILCQKTEPHD